MKLILQETRVGLGKLGDSVTVKAGYGRNYLIPQGKAVPATVEHMAIFEKRRAGLEKAEAEKLAAATTRADAVRDKVVVITMHASEEGRLYGSVTPAEIVASLSEMGFEIEKAEVLLAEPMRDVGEHSVVLKFHPEVEASVLIRVLSTHVESDVEDEPEAEDVADASYDEFSADED